MADQRTDDLPEGTDQVIEGANLGAIATDPTAPDQGGQTITIDDATLVTEKEVAAPKGNAERPVTGSGSPKGGLAGRLRDGRERIAGQAGDKARGLVSQGLERTAEALANVSKMVGDTADGIEDRLGPDYGDYARRAAGAIENVANTSNFVRNSPGIALAGAAVVGFVVARLVKGGLARDDEED